MIASTTLLLFILGIFSSFKVSVKADKLLSFFVFAAFSVIFAQFCWDIFNRTEHIYSFLWSRSPGNDIKIDIISNPYNYGIIFPFFAVTLLAIIQNLIFRYEERRTLYAAGLIFNLVALIMMITSNNFVQLLFALFVADILVLVMIRDVEAYRRFILMNMAADFIIFTILAVINSRVASLDIREILQYKQTGRHLDFIALFGLTAVFIKMGLYLFHIGICGLKNIRLHRLLNVLFLSAPVCGTVLLLKFHVLWTGSAYFVPYLQAMCLLSFAGGFFISLIRDSFKEKIIGLMMMFWALLATLLRFNGFVWNQNFSLLVLQMFMLMWAVYLIYYYTGRRKKISVLKNIGFVNATALNCAYVLLLLSVAAVTNTLSALYNKGNRDYIWAFAILFILSLTAVVKTVYFTPKTKPQSTTSKLSAHYPCWVVSGIAMAFFLNRIKIFEPELWGFSVAFVILSLCTPLWHVNLFFAKQKYQQIDWIGKVYKYALIKPLRLSGRVLWLLIDHLFMEKIIIGFSINVAQCSLRFFRRLHSNKHLGGLIVLTLLAGFLCLAYYYE